MNILAGRELRYAFPRTVPIMVGYLFLGMAYGILMKVNGYGFWWCLAMSVFVYGGSLQYLGITLLAGQVHPAYAFLMGLMLSARQLFYGISMLGKYQNIKTMKPYLIFALTDETFSLVCHDQAPQSLNQGLVYFWISLLDQIYWVAGSLLGVAIGSLISFDTTGLDFALTALFVVIFTDQWKSQPNHRPALLGLAAPILSLTVFGPDRFIIPAMLMIVGVLAAGYHREKGRASA